MSENNEMRRRRLQAMVNRKLPHFYANSAESPFLTCIHMTSGMCDACMGEYREDPSAWIEYGNHVAGLKRWEELRVEMVTTSVDSDWICADCGSDKLLPVPNETGRVYCPRCKPGGPAQFA